MSVPPCVGSQNHDTDIAARWQTLTSALVLSVTSIKNSAPVSTMCSKMHSLTLRQKVRVCSKDILHVLTPHPSYLSWKRKGTPFPPRLIDPAHRNAKGHCTDLRGQVGTSASYHHQPTSGKATKSPSRYVGISIS